MTPGLSLNSSMTSFIPHQETIEYQTLPQICFDLHHPALCKILALETLHLLRVFLLFSIWPLLAANLMHAIIGLF